MFHQLKNIDSAFKHVRLFSLVLIVASAVIACYAVYRSYAFVDTVQKRIYVISNGKALEAVAGNRADNIGVEARNHVEDFHHWFFTLTPDEKAITSNITRALYLADESAKKQYDNLTESGYYAQIVSANISQDVTKDSIVVNTEAYPYHFTFYGKERIVRSTAIVTRKLVTEGYLRELKQRTDQNSHALLIERWAILENSDIEVIKR